MKHMLIIWLTLVIWFLIFPKPVATDSDDDEDSPTEDPRGNCPCEVETYGPEIEAGYIKSPDYPRFDGCNGRCTYIILPHPNKTVTLYTAQYEVSAHATLDIWSISMVGDTKLMIPHASIKRSSSYYYSSADESFPTFISAKNAGFEIHFRTHNMNYYTNFKISFDRYSDYPEICDSNYVEVGKEEVVVQNDHYFRSASGCVYFLKPKAEDMINSEDEILISINGSTENAISLRLPNRTGKRIDYPPVTSATTLLASAYNAVIFSHKVTRSDGIYKFSRITAKLVGKSCSCGEKEYLLYYENTTTVSLTSPGYPYLYCPSRECKTLVYPADHQFEMDQVGLLDISIKATLAPKDLLEVKNEAKTFFRSSEYTPKGEKIHERFVIKQQGLGVHWKSDTTHNRRLYEINVTQVLVPLECTCTLYRDKKITTARQFEFTFPPNCTFIYCYYQFSPPGYYNRAWSIEFSVENAVEGDTVVINDNQHTEKYVGGMLHKTRRFEVIDNCDFTFFRENLESDKMTELSVNWARTGTYDSCDGKTFEYWVYDKHPVILTSPDYPQNYADDQECEFLIYAEEGHRMVFSIDEISLENFHDHIYIYQGNSTDGPLLYTFTSHVSHHILNFTEFPILLLFQTDRSTNDRGFHITAKVLPIEVLPENPSFTLTFVIIALVLALIIAILLGIYYLKMRRDRARAEEEAKRPTTDVSPHAAGIALEPRNPNRNDYEAELSSIF